MSDGITEARRGTYFPYTEDITSPPIDYKTHGVEYPTTNQWQIPNQYLFSKHMPNQKWHKIISFIKSGVRIVGYCFIPFSLVTATILLILSEVIGIIEELV